MDVKLNSEYFRKAQWFYGVLAAFAFLGVLGGSLFSACFCAFLMWLTWGSHNKMVELQNAEQDQDQQ